MQSSWIELAKNFYLDEHNDRLTYLALADHAKDKQVQENIRRIGAVAEILAQTGIIALTAFISPYRVDRDMVRAKLNPGEFIEVFVDAPIEVCEQRDPKGLYKKARAGEIKGFTGIDDPYESPQSAELVLDTSDLTPEVCAQQVIDYRFKSKV